MPCCCSATKRGRSKDDGDAEALAGHCLAHKLPAARDMKREDSSEAASAVTLNTVTLLLKANQECYTYPSLPSQSAQSSQGGEQTYQNSLSRGMGSQNSLSSPLLLDLNKNASMDKASTELDTGVAELLRSRDTDTMLHRQMVTLPLECDDWVCTIVTNLS